MTAPTPARERAPLDLLIRAFQINRLVRLAADLGLADKIAPDKGVNVRDVAEACSVQAGQLLRVFRALAAFGIFRLTPDGVVSHSPQSLRLRSDTPGSLRNAARFFAAPGSWGAWGALEAALSGKVPFEVAWKKSRFNYLREHPDEARLYDDFMAQFPDNRHAAVAKGYDFSNVALIADIGGGNGEALRQILARFPESRGIVFDRADVVEAIPASALLNGRIEVAGGSLFEAIPAGADLYLLIAVLHNWPDEDAIRILKGIRSAMGANARLLIVEQILEPDPSLANPMTYLLDMQMMAMFGSARERTEAEYRDLLAASGFKLSRIIPTRSPVSLLEAIPE
jgi:trans-aconitate methyltransferase